MLIIAKQRKGPNLLGHGFYHVSGEVFLHNLGGLFRVALFVLLIVSGAGTVLLAQL